MKFKKIVFCFCFLLIGCATKPTTSEGTMHAFFKAFKSTDFAQMNRLSTDPIDTKVEDEYHLFAEWASSSETKKEVHSILKETETSWILEFEDTQNATYYTTINYYNLTELKENYLEYFIKAFDNHKNATVYDQEIAAAYRTASLYSVPSLEKTIRIYLHKEGSTWLIMDSTTLFNDLSKPIINQVYAVDD